MPLMNLVRTYLIVLVVNLNLKPYMNLEIYQQRAALTCAALPPMAHKEHMFCGIITEIGEIVDIYKKNIAYDKEIDRVNLLEEIADVTWYIANWATEEKVILSNPDPSFYANTHHLSVSRGSLQVFDSLNAYENDPQLFLNYFYGWISKSPINVTEEEFYKSLENNINKLLSRYKNKSFSKENALNRDLTKEREQLEKQ